MSNDTKKIRITLDSAVDAYKVEGKIGDEVTIAKEVAERMIESGHAVDADKDKGTK